MTDKSRVELNGERIGLKEGNISGGAHITIPIGDDFAVVSFKEWSAKTESIMLFEDNQKSVATLPKGQDLIEELQELTKEGVITER